MADPERNGTPRSPVRSKPRHLRSAFGLGRELLAMGARRSTRAAPSFSARALMACPAARSVFEVRGLHLVQWKYRHQPDGMPDVLSVGRGGLFVVCLVFQERALEA